MNKSTHLTILSALALLVPAVLFASEIDSMSRIDVPAGWQTAERIGSSVALAYRAPAVAGDHFEENVNWVVSPLEAETGFEEYSRRAVAEVLGGVPDARLLESAPDTLAGDPAYRIVFTGRLGARPMKWLQTWTFHDGKIYVATYSADVADYESRLADANEAIRSLRFRDPVNQRRTK